MDKVIENIIEAVAQAKKIRDDKAKSLVNLRTILMEWLNEPIDYVCIGEEYATEIRNLARNLECCVRAVSHINDEIGMLEAILNSCGNNDAEKLVIWGYFKTPLPFGYQRTAKGYEMEVKKLASSKRDLGKGYSGYVINHNGHTIIVESSTGVLMGTSLEQVKMGIQELEDVYLRERIAAAAGVKKEIVSQQDFWNSHLNHITEGF